MTRIFDSGATRIGLALAAAVVMTAVFARPGWTADRPTATHYAFEAIDGYSNRSMGRILEIRGVLIGEATPVDLEFEFRFSDGAGFPASDACRRDLLTMMERPGKYILSLDHTGYTQWHCSLDLRR